MPTEAVANFHLSKENELKIFSLLNFFFVHLA